MMLLATNTVNDVTIAISNISAINEENGIYYIQGDRNLKEMSEVAVTVSINGIILFNAYKIEFDSRRYRNIRLS